MRAWSILATLLMVGAPAYAGDKVLLQPIPAWVKPATAPPPAAKPDDAPISVLLADQQVRMDRDGLTVFARSHLRINTAAGLAVGNISLPWRPDVGDLTVHRLVIHRGKEAIDVLAAGQAFTVVRRETNLESAILDGLLTANIQPEGLQVGDTLELVTSVTVRDPVLAGHADYAFAFASPTPIGRLSVRASWPAGRPIRVQARDLAMTKPTRVGDDQVVELAIDNVTPFMPPKLAPTRFRVGRQLELSDFAGWRDVAALLAPLYTKAAVLPAEGPLAQEVARIRAASTDPQVRAAAALALVQDRVRYVALAMGSGGLVPADAATTWSRRYGDCKAKTALLLAILRALDIAADPVAVHSTMGDGVDQRLPAISAFDHVLVRATIAGRTYWLDGTRLGDTALDRIQTPDFGWGLPLVAQNGALVRMAAPPLDRPSLNTEIAIDATAGLGVPAPIKVVQTMRGDDAAGFNSGLSSLSGETRDQFLRDMWKRQYDFVDPDRVAAAFDRATGEMVLTLDGKARMDWSSGWYETDGLSLGYKADLSRPAGPNRDAPYSVGHPTYQRTVETIRLPAGFAADTPLKNVAVNRTIGGMEYRRSGSLTGQVFRVEASQRSVASEFPASEAPAVEAALREMAETTLYIRRPASYRLTDAELKLGDAAPPKTVDGLLQRGFALNDRARYDDAIKAFDAALALEPKNEWALANRGLVHVWKRDFTTAERDLAAVEATSPRNIVLLRARALSAELRGNDPNAAIALYGKVLAEAPGDEFALVHRGDMARRNGQHAAALADYDTLIARHPKNSELHLKRFNALRSAGRNEEAYRAMVEAVAVADPKDTLARVSAGKAFATLGRREEAMRAFDQALAIAPEAYIYINRAQSRPAGDLAGQVSDYDAALKLEPDSPDALNGKAGILSKQGKFAEALPLVERLVADDPKDADVLNTRGMLHARAGRRAEADRDFKAARRLAADSGLALNSLCWAKATAGVALEDALVDCDAALARVPNAAGVIDSRAMVLLRLGRLDDAIATFSKALALAPEQSPSRYGRGVALARKGERARAEQDLAAARKADPQIAERFAEYGVTPGP